MASETALLASRFAVSIAQTRALVASWLESDPKGKADTKNNGSGNTAGSDRDDLLDEAESDEAESDEEQGKNKERSREIGLDKAKQRNERANAQGHEDVRMSTEDETSANDEDNEFSKKYTIIVGRGGIGTPASSDTSESLKPSVSAFRQRKTIEFMQKQIHKRRAENTRLQVISNSRNSGEVDEDGDEEESRTTAVQAGAKRPGSDGPMSNGPPFLNTHPASESNGNDTSIPTPTKKIKHLSVLDDLILQRQEQQRRKKKKKKRVSKGTSEA
ncbi:hypothetical protein V1509DRAFT_133629 [Lipomyces kononenkoae]